MLKSLSILLALLFVMSKSNAQQYFQADSQTIKTELLARQYTFNAYNLDSLKLIDSTLIFHNSAHFIIRKDQYRIGDTVKSTTLFYFNRLGKDSVEKYFENEIIKSVTTTSYDSLGRVVEVSTRAMNEPVKLVKEIQLFHVPKDGNAFELQSKRVKVTQEEYDYFTKHNLTETRGRKDSLEFMIFTTVTNVANGRTATSYEYHDTLVNGKDVVLVHKFNNDNYLYTGIYEGKGKGYSENPDLDVNMPKVGLDKALRERCFTATVVEIPMPKSIAKVEQCTYDIIQNESVKKLREKCWKMNSQSIHLFQNRDKSVQLRFTTPLFITDFDSPRLTVLIKQHY